MLIRISLRICNTEWWIFSWLFWEIILAPSSCQGPSLAISSPSPSSYRYARVSLVIYRLSWLWHSPIEGQSLFLYPTLSLTNNRPPSINFSENNVTFIPTSQDEMIWGTKSKNSQSFPKRYVDPAESQLIWLSLSILTAMVPTIHNRGSRNINIAGRLFPCSFLVLTFTISKTTSWYSSYPCLMMQYCSSHSIQGNC